MSDIPFSAIPSRDRQPVLSERIEGFPLDYGQTVDILGYVVNQRAVAEVMTWRQTDVWSSEAGRAFNIQLVEGREWKLAYALWFDPLPSDISRMAFSGSVDRFIEDYTWVKLRG